MRYPVAQDFLAPMPSCESVSATEVVLVESHENQPRKTCAKRTLDERGAWYTMFLLLEMTSFVKWVCNDNIGIPKEVA